MQRDWTNTLQRYPYVSLNTEGGWEEIGAEFFTYHEKEYPVCYKSNYWELDSPSNTESATVIKKLKSHMAWYSIPKQLVTDYGPQFTSTKFKSFTKTWGIEHTTTSPHHRRANRNVESAVKTAKKCWRLVPGSTKYREHTNPRCCHEPSTASPRKTERSLPPSTRSLLEPRSPPNFHEMKQLQLSQKRQQSDYNWSAHDLPALNAGNAVRMKPFVLGKHDWDKDTMKRRLDERSYGIQTLGSPHRRNRQHLVKSPTQPEKPNETIPVLDPLPGRGRRDQKPDC